MRNAASLRLCARCGVRLSLQPSFYFLGEDKSWVRDDWAMVFEEVAGGDPFVEPLSLVETTLDNGGLSHPFFFSFCFVF